MKKVMKDMSLKVMFNILKIYMNFIMISTFTRKNEIEKVKKLVASLHDITEYVMHIRKLNQALNQGFVLKKIHRLIKFNQNAWLKPHINMNTDLRKKAIKMKQKRDNYGYNCPFRTFNSRII